MRRIEQESDRCSQIVKSQLDERFEQTQELEQRLKRGLEQELEQRLSRTFGQMLEQRLQQQWGGARNQRVDQQEVQDDQRDMEQKLVRDLGQESVRLVSPGTACPSNPSRSNSSPQRELLELRAAVARTGDLRTPNLATTVNRSPGLAGNDLENSPRRQHQPYPSAASRSIEAPPCAAALTMHAELGPLSNQTDERDCVHLQAEIKRRMSYMDQCLNHIEERLLFKAENEDAPLTPTRLHSSSASNAAAPCADHRCGPGEVSSLGSQGAVGTTSTRSRNSGRMTAI